MRILLVNTYDASGGAARAALRLLSGLRALGTNASMLVKSKAIDHPHVRQPERRLVRWLLARSLSMEKLPRPFYRRRRFTVWGTNWFPTGVDREINACDADIVHLHWLGHGFVQIDALARIRRPLVWTLHDMWAFTGGCHIDQGCGRYQEACGACPQLGSTCNHDLSRWIWWRKSRAWRDLKLAIVTPSRWLAECARASSLFGGREIVVIPNGIDERVFRPRAKLVARQQLQLVMDRKLILFGALDSTTEPNKGFHLLRPCLQRLASDGWRERAVAVVFGASAPVVPVDLGLGASYVGRIDDDDRLAALYAAADVFVAPSLQENLSNTVMEALSCGTPSAAFAIGGMPDMIEHERNGYLARPYECDDLARGIAWILEDDQRHQRLSERARAKVLEDYTLSQVAQRYKALYDRVLSGS